MGSRGTEIDDHSSADNTPEDVAVLYSWANLRGAKYRDYSASRREYRAQVRYRAAKALLERELKAQDEAEAVAKQAEREAFAAEAIALSQSEHDTKSSRLESLRTAETAAQRAATHRVEAARRAEAVARANVLAQREEREIAEAHASAQEQATIYAQSELRRRQLAGPQPRLPMGQGAGLDYRRDKFEAESLDESREFVESNDSRPQAGLSESPFVGFGIAAHASLLDTDTNTTPAAWQFERLAAKEAVEVPNVIATIEQSGPAWLFSGQIEPRSPAAPVLAPGVSAEPAGQTLQDSREQVASRWFALKGVFEERSGPKHVAVPPPRPGDTRTPLIAVYSLAGGVGKTSLVAALGRALSLKGEKSVLIDTTSNGLLPYHFGARDLRAGVVQSFTPPSQKTGEQISFGNFDAGDKSGDQRQEVLFVEEILSKSTGDQRMVLDMSAGSAWLIRRMANLHPTVLVPITPDMNSVISLQAMEKMFRSITDSEGRPVLPYYVLNRFVAALPLHLDVREVFRRQLGERLLKVAIRDSPAVSEALAEGMTVLDYAPISPVSLDLLDVAAWVQTTSPLATAEFRTPQWSEQ